MSLVKVEREMCGGDVLYHAFVNKSEEESKALEKKHADAKDLKRKRRDEQETNVKRKDAEKKVKVDAKKAKREAKLAVIDGGKGKPAKKQKKGEEEKDK